MWGWWWGLMWCFKWYNLVVIEIGDGDSAVAGVATVSLEHVSESVRTS